MARKRRMRKLAAKRAAEKEKEAKSKSEPVIETAKETTPAPSAPEESLVKEEPKKTRRLWSKNISSEE